MGSGKKDDHKHRSCVCEVVRAIKDIQDEVHEKDCECGSSCFLEPIGSISPKNDKKRRRKRRPNTRVFVLSNADGSPFHAFMTNVDNCACTSIFFRVEEVFDNCCATLRVLEPVKEVSNGCYETADIVDGCCIDLSKICKVDGFRSTDSCITVDLDCFCAVQCIEDVHINLDTCAEYED
ncbi:CotY/CotZ family spore coat protein [Cytobacillus horneckiae]|uniref:Spore coat protein CotZ n=1 Tax=Cytobacillus horneckiae TaxID=549687 RepID=A0A2N0ZF89_9BACI|nr:CotY/CotZ family spore coat protein [Cytobacillus horneckiae]MBN6887517.1 spore coat protein CotZ [Cytobacillus horneckiae]MCM3178576.1 CotY/CotZ family spore coat protein [Cytobacillus horneckiae]MEC1155603.1 CotY/CotZ family spore coat protein [Cytobacillus horneckiae]MED2936922.1 CotY/CotZ family spore coat protein [Cytobacillus horneckiae]PKG28158.1 spore coat protein CotZ [Cytobacillus horneckiae]